VVEGFWKGDGDLLVIWEISKYVYRKRGILDDIPYYKLIRGVFVIQDKDKKRIIDFLERFSAEYYIHIVEPTEEDCEVMGLQIE